MDAAVDAIGREIKEGDVIAYATTQGRSAVLRLALVDVVKKNKQGVWRLKVAPIYDPGGYSHNTNLLLTDNPKTARRNVEASPRVFIVSMTQDALSERVKRLEAIARLSE